MRNRLPAVLLLLLSWFLPAAAHAQAAQQAAALAAGHGPGVPAVHGPSRPAEQQHAVLRHVPHPPPAVRAWSPPGVAGGVPGVADVPPPVQAGFPHPWAVVVPRPACGAPAGCRPPATPPRAPPSTRH